MSGYGHWSLLVVGRSSSPPPEGQLLVHGNETPDKAKLSDHRNGTATIFDIWWFFSARMEGREVLLLVYAKFREVAANGAGAAVKIKLGFSLCMSFLHQFVHMC
ncbi:hypothetical protein VPH35_096167 [Triticum aestivum]